MAIGLGCFTFYCSIFLFHINLSFCRAVGVQFCACLPLGLIREFKKTTTGTSCRTAPNNTNNREFNPPTQPILGNIEITSWKVRAYDFYSRVEKYRKTNE